MPNETKLAPQQWSFSSTRTQSGFLDKWISVPALLGLSSPIQKPKKNAKKLPYQSDSDSLPRSKQSRHHSGQGQGWEKHAFPNMQSDSR